MHLCAELTAAFRTLEPFGEIGAYFSLQLSSRTRFDKINKKKVIAENQCEKHKKSSLVVFFKYTTMLMLFGLSNSPAANQHLMEECLGDLSMKTCYIKTCLKWPLKNRQNKGLNDKLRLNEGQKYCKMLSWSIQQLYF